MTTVKSVPDHKSSQPELRTWLLSSPREMEHIYAIRYDVFVKEQGLTSSVYDDPDDRYSVHVLAAIGDEVVGTGRVTFIGDEAQIAWVAVQLPYRAQGVGRAVMEHLLRVSVEQRVRIISLNAQTHALHFYEMLGFRAVGRRFHMSNIEHQHMILEPAE